MAKPTSQRSKANPTRAGAADSDVYMKADTVAIDKRKVLARMETLGINKTQLGERSDVGRTKVYRMLKHGYVEAYDLSQIAAVLETMSKALQPNSAFTEPEEPSFSIQPPRNWTIESFLCPHMLSANGVGYGVTRLKSTIAPL